MSTVEVKDPVVERLVTAKTGLPSCERLAEAAFCRHGVSPQEDWVPYRVAPLGSHAVELPVKREINRFLAEEDPYGTFALCGSASNGARSAATSPST
ncbi:hypothetical protein HUT19_03235 [Streptomyces sp. NA02950]|uniref:hypothetical protein n=1 Tax=Streptomyces sp. NA02950 TaxID=2742137 RepID=UPI0015919B9B|nr:hypothetical protein [Streptomyces sp. NA02950]QKV90874.1 hypothetical protein HUT19_03235 [Streptomyces sp. NA02950]